MNDLPTLQLAPPRIETSRPMVLAGFTQRHESSNPMGIPAQWQTLQPYLGHIPGQVGRVAYGVCYNFDEQRNFDYLCGVEVSSDAGLPAGMATLVMPAQQYAMFAHPGHISGIRVVFAAIWSSWLPTSGMRALNAPTVERYGPEFNPSTGLGGFEVWIPVEANT